MKNIKKKNTKVKYQTVNYTVSKTLSNTKNKVIKSAFSCEWLLKNSSYDMQMNISHKVFTSLWSRDKGYSLHGNLQVFFPCFLLITVFFVVSIKNNSQTPIFYKRPPSLNTKATSKITHPLYFSDKYKESSLYLK